MILLLNFLYVYQDDVEDKIEVMPNSKVYCTTNTLAIAKSQSSPNQALIYLLKRLYSIERLSYSSLGNRSKKDFAQLPVNEVATIKGSL